jgi:hypothetical protein
LQGRCEQPEEWEQKVLLGRLRRLLGYSAGSAESVPPFVVNTPGYNETSGGTIVMHYLVDQLRSLGFAAYVYPWVEEREHIGVLQGGEKAFASSASERFANYRLNPGFDTSIASFEDLKRCIAVYPLLVKGNPLQAETVVRWHIYRKSLRPNAQFSDGEIDFFYSKSFYEGPGALSDARLLRLTYEFKEHYNEAPSGERTADCYMIRKGESYSEEAIKLIPSSAIRVDDMSHAEMAKMFKMSRRFFSFDLYTAYEYYAAVCGCIPIVIPRPGLSRSQWRSEEKDRYGVAYGTGTEEIDWAVSTRSARLALQERSRREEMETVRTFSQFMAASYRGRNSGPDSRIG